MEPADVEAEVGGVAKQVAHLQPVLLLQQQGVHAPEGTLGRCGFRSLGGKARVRVDVTQGHT
ncbi:hypothetical protein GCM10010448_43990 [Streptomyces glomeratus]|uniref:Uncharacterized protein n=1 Tax=Streptomyces glomeratus TaxID=284452 RepID=A0ABP6LQG7_9ACTN